MTVPIFNLMMPDKSQSEDVFNALMVPLLNYITKLAPHINTFGAEMVALVDVGVYSEATAYNIPDAVVGLNGMTYRCIGSDVSGDNPVGSVTDNWVRLTIEGTGMPVGSTMGWPTAIEPGQWFEEDGCELSKLTYAGLYAVLGTEYGETDGAGGVGTTHFRLRDTRGLFKRSWDHGAGVDPNAANRTDRGDGTGGDIVGSKQTHATAMPNTAFITNSDSHSHTFATFPEGTGNGNQVRSTNATSGIGFEAINSDSHSHTITGGGDLETTVKNIYEMSVIKYE